MACFISESCSEIDGPAFFVRLHRARARLERAIRAVDQKTAFDQIMDFSVIKKLGNEPKYADQKKAAYALVIGPDEAARGVVQVKSLKTGDEQALTLVEACALIAARG